METVTIDLTKEQIEAGTILADRMNMSLEEFIKSVFLTKATDFLYHKTMHKVKSVKPLENYRLMIEFTDNTKKMYEVRRLFRLKSMFGKLKDKDFFRTVYVDLGGDGIVWDDDIDLSSYELWNNGIEVEKPNEDTLTAFKEVEDIRSGKKKAKKYTSTAELKKDLKL